MAKVLVSLAAVLILVGPAVAEEDTGPNPVEIAKRCADRLDKASEQCAKCMAATAARTVKDIQRLLAAEKPAAARALARRRIESIHKKADHCVKAIRVQAAKCIHVLNRLGAPELADRLAGVRERAVTVVRRAERAAVKAIRAALPGPDTEE